MEIQNSDFQSAIGYFTNQETKSWKEVLNLGNSDNIELEEKRRLSWVWPEIASLNELKTLLKKLKIRTILSIGCGCGLFEWILRESVGINVYGLERDRPWWCSNATVKFIKLSFIDDLKPNCLPETFMQRCCDIHDVHNWSFAIMFVYFNNRPAFLNYLEMYKGQWVIIIGPKPGIHVYTDPLPLEPNFPNDSQWQLCESINIGPNNILTIYKHLNEIA